MFSIEGKNIIITGASSGIGRNCAIKIAEAGANAILLARDEKRLNETLSLLNEGKHCFYSCDVTKFDELEKIISEVVDKIGSISGFIHSAGIEKTIPLRSMKVEIYYDLFLVNTISAFEISKIISKKKYVNKEGASFIFISSIMGVLGEVGKTAYCSSKSALIGGAKAMALELASKNIRVNTISPGMVMTKMASEMFVLLPEEKVKEIMLSHPLGLGDVDDISNACLFLLSDMSKWITGTNLIIDGGYSAK